MAASRRLLLLVRAIEAGAIIRFEPEDLRWAYFSHEFIIFGEPEGSEFGGAYFNNEFITFDEPEGDQFGGAYFNVT